MPLETRPAAAADAARAVAIERVAYGPSPLNSALFPGPFPPDDEARAGSFAELHRDSACRWAKVVDTDLEAQGAEAMIAFSMWYFWQTLPDAAPPHPAWGAGANADACDLFFGTMTAEWTNRMAGKPHVYLKYLQTDPRHQRRGAGSMLLKWGTAEADRLGLPCYLEATEAGRPQYEKRGFRPVGTALADLSRWGGPAAAELVLMLRPAAGA